MQIFKLKFATCIRPMYVQRTNKLKVNTRIEANIYKHI